MSAGSPGPDGIPIHILTGFLGSGKTTLLNKWLAHDNMQSTAIIVNEFGAVGVDQHLISAPAGDAVLLDNGCVCCVLREDLIVTLTDLAQSVREGRIPPFRRVVVETTGLADPTPIVQTFVRKARNAPGFRIGSVVTVIDPIFHEATSRNFIEWRQQVACADHIVASKRDLAADAQICSALEAAGRINPLASRSVAAETAGPPDVLMADIAGAASGRMFPPTIETSGLASHSGDVTSFCIFPGETLSWSQLALWLEGLVSIRGEDFLRIKGIVKLCDCDKPVLVQSVQKIFHPLVELEKWPDDCDPRSRVVFITKGVAASRVEQALRTVVALPAN